MAAASTLAPGVARKLKKVLETRTTDNPDVLASLATLSTFYAENTPQARRNLKSSIEQRGLSINDHFLDASLPAHMALDRVDKEVNVLTQCCEQPFKVRVEQVLQPQPSLLISYKLTNTLEFYSFTISELLGKETALCNTMSIVKDAAQQSFFNIVKSRGEKLQRYPPLVPAELSHPTAGTGPEDRRRAALIFLFIMLKMLFVYDELVFAIHVYEQFIFCY